MERICERCNVTFNIPAAWIRRGGGRFCSSTCYAAHQGEHPHGGTGKPAQPSVQLVCQRCGSTFRVGVRYASQRFCSRACRHVTKMHSVACKKCGALFEDYITGRRQYCFTCNPVRPKGPPKPLLTCKRCGRIFRATRATDSHCSEECRRPPSILTCETCGKQFRVVPAMAHQRFCSTRCYRRFQGETGPEARARECLEILGITFLQEHHFAGWSYPVDFFLPELRTVLEIDGVYWHTKPGVAARDVRKTLFLQSLGYTVVRLPDTPFYDGVSDALVAYVRDALALTNGVVARSDMTGLYPIQLSLPFDKEGVI